MSPYCKTNIVIFISGNEHHDTNYEETAELGINHGTSAGTTDNGNEIDHSIYRWRTRLLETLTPLAEATMIT